jgi:hypothetical protein
VLAENAAEVRKGAEARTDQQVEKITKAYDKLLDSLNNVNAAMERTREIEAARREADRSDEDAKLALEEQQAIAGLAPGDDIGRRRIDAQFNARRAAISASRGGEDSGAKADALRDQASAARAEAALAAAQADALVPKRADVIGQAAAASAVQQRDAGRWYLTPLQQDQRLKDAQPGIDKLIAKMDALADEIKKQRETAANLNAEAAAFDQLAAIASRGAGTASVSGRAASVASSIAMGEIDRDAAAVEARRQAARDAQAHAEKKAELEIPAATPTPPTP